MHRKKPWKPLASNPRLLAITPQVQAGAPRLFPVERSLQARAGLVRVSSW